MLHIEEISKNLHFLQLPSPSEIELPTLCGIHIILTSLTWSFFFECLIFVRPHKSWVCVAFHLALDEVVGVLVRDLLGRSVEFQYFCEHKTSLVDIFFPNK